MDRGEIQLDQAKVEAALAEMHPCAHGHKWKLVGARACCCDLGDGLCGECSLPVHECTRCGDSDYGENADAEVTRAQCVVDRA